jgi:LCP family protein required for cell wall assembly
MKRAWARRWQILGWISTVMAVVVLVSAIAGYAVLRARLSGIRHVKQIDLQNRPPRYTDALNILLIGSDTRSGRKNRAIGGRGGCDCSDTLMIAHISPGRGRVTVVSIPRDTMVPLVACSPWGQLPGQQANPYAMERINATLANGGPECVRTTVEQETGIFISSFIQLNFTGFEKVINDVGGVNVCLPFAIDNPATAFGGSGLHLAAGRHHIWGRVALQFWRTRENIADGSDLARIARDQYLMAQVVRGVLHSGMLTSATRLYTVIGDVAGAMTTDASNSDLLSIASSLSGVSLSKVQFITTPWASYPYDPNEVVFAEPQADAVFWALAHDAKLPRVARAHGSQGTATSMPAVAIGPDGTGSGKGTGLDLGALMRRATISPSQVQVQVLNGSSGVSLVAQAAAALTSRGFQVLGTGYATSLGYHTPVIEYSSAADLPAANTLRQQFSSVKVKQVAGLAPGTIQVILGSGFTALAPPQPTSQAAINDLSTTYGGITADARCRDSAFYGTYDPSPTPSSSPSPSPSSSASSPAPCAC